MKNIILVLLCIMPVVLLQTGCGSKKKKLAEIEKCFEEAEKNSNSEEKTKLKEACIKNHADTVCADIKNEPAKKECEELKKKTEQTAAAATTTTTPPPATTTPPPATITP